jgi:hypothetical protein
LQSKRLRIDFISEITLLSQVKDYIEEILATIMPKKVSAPLNKLKKYCDYIKETNPIYFNVDHAKTMGYSKPLVPLGYFPTLITPIIQELFLTKLPKLVKGIIHITSEIEHHEPMFADTTYISTIELTDIFEKSGKKGEYFQTDFLISLTSENGEKIAIDRHSFFLKIN